MPGLEDVAIGLGASVGSLIGIPWQQKLQKELMHENEAINVRQWERENAYNSPSAQMRRLKEAGLNPDLAIAGNVQNTAGSITPTSGTPQAAGAASAVGRGVSNALDAMQVESQIELNESAAEKNRAEAGGVKVDTKFKLDSYEVKMKQLWANLGFTQEQTKQASAQIEQIGMSCLVLQKQVENYNELFRNYDVQRKLWSYQALKEGFEAGIKRIDLEYHRGFMSSLVDRLESEAGLNKAYAAKLRTENAFLLSTFSDRAGQIREGYLSSRYENKLNEAKYQYQMAMISYLPYQMADVMFNSAKFYERDDKGQIIYGDNGMPKLKEGLVAWDVGYHYIRDVTTTLESVTRSFENVGMGLGAIRGFGFGSSSSGTPSVPQSLEQSVPYDEDKARGLYQKYVNASPNSDAQRAARDEWLSYRKKYGK